MFTLRSRTPHYTFVGAGLPSPYDPTACANNYGIYYNTHSNRRKNGTPTNVYVPLFAGTDAAEC